MAKNKSTVSPRWAKFCGWLLRRLGWTSDGGPMVEKKAIVLGVPHTTIWDFLVSYLFYAKGEAPSACDRDYAECA